MPSTQSIHKPVLLHEVIQGLISFAPAVEGPRGPASRPAGLAPTSRPLRPPKVPLEPSPAGAKSIVPWYLDGTLGGAGHTLAIIEALQGKVNVICLDRDPQAIERARESLEGKAQRLILENANFRDLDKVLDRHGIRSVDMILLDLGISSDELENSGRGFSFLKDEPLLMNMGEANTHPFTARDIVNVWKEEDIANVIFAYGEERYARKIAKAIVSYREKKPIETTFELSEIVKGAVPAWYRRGRIHPATRTFQALRITVNDELEALRAAVRKGYEHLNTGGRMAVISFHSLEDRIVKDFYKDQARSGGSIITKKPIRPSAEEIRDNPRARSARLRIIEKTKGSQKE